MFSLFKSRASLDFSRYIDSIEYSNFNKFELDQMLYIVNESGDVKQEEPGTEISNTSVDINISRGDRVNYFINLKAIVQKDGKLVEKACKVNTTMDR